MSDHDDYMDDYGYDGFDDFEDEDEPPMGYVIVGWRANFKYGVATQQMADAFGAACVESFPKLRHFLPGRSQYAEHYSSVIIGVRAESVESEYGPEALNPFSILNDLNLLPDKLEISAQIKEDFPFFEALASETPKVYLMTDGPLPCAAVLFGQRADAFPADVGDLDRFMCTNMRQEGVAGGAVWGARLGYVDHDDVSELDLSDEARAQHAERTSALENPEYYLCVRYD